MLVLPSFLAQPGSEGVSHEECGNVMQKRSEQQNRVTMKSIPIRTTHNYESLFRAYGNPGRYC